MTKHIPVLRDEALEMMDLMPGMVVVDATLGGGGYGREIVTRIAPGGMYIGIDQDLQAIDRVKGDLWVSDAKKNGVSVRLIHGNFSELENLITDLNEIKIDAIVADLGISSDQLEDAERGLSFSLKGPLDMRLDTSTNLKASDIVNQWDVEGIAGILCDNAGEKNAGRIARAIVREREKKSIETTDELAEIICKSVSGAYRGKKIHPATKTFMALRMAVNREQKSLEKFLKAAVENIRKGGRIVVVSFHSGEDAWVKHFFQSMAKGCICPVEFPVCRCEQVPRVRLLTKRAIVPSDKEIECNARARSAKMRGVQKI